jgi:hypothetical protein
MISFIKGVIGIGMVGAGAIIGLVGLVAFGSGFQEPFKGVSDIVIRLVLYTVVGGLLVGAGFVLARCGVRLVSTPGKSRTQAVSAPTDYPANGDQQGSVHFQCPECGSFVSARDSHCANCGLDLLHGPKQPTTSSSVLSGVQTGLFAVAGACVLFMAWAATDSTALVRGILFFFGGPFRW